MNERVVKLARKLFESKNPHHDWGALDWTVRQAWQALAELAIADCEAVGRGQVCEMLCDGIQQGCKNAPTMKEASEIVEFVVGAEQAAGWARRHEQGDHVPATHSGVVHELKTLPEFYEAVRTGAKTFEARRDDRRFNPGDLLVLREWSSDGGYSGRESRQVVTYILRDSRFVAEGFAILGMHEFRCPAYGFACTNCKPGECAMEASNDAA